MNMTGRMQPRQQGRSETEKVSKPNANVDYRSENVNKEGVKS